MMKLENSLIKRGECIDWVLTPKSSRVELERKAVASNDNKME